MVSTAQQRSPPTVHSWQVRPFITPVSSNYYGFGFLQTRGHPQHPCRSANTSPCRACRGLSPSSHQPSHHCQAGCACAQRAMPGAHKKKGPSRDGPKARSWVGAGVAVSFKPSRGPPLPAANRRWPARFAGCLRPVACTTWRPPRWPHRCRSGWSARGPRT